MLLYLGENMHITAENLAKINAEFNDYLEGDIFKQFLAEFEARTAAGYWATGSFGCCYRSG
jgi:hypothetical protein